MTEQAALLSPQDLIARSGDSAWVVVDCRFKLLDPEAGRAAYLQEHIPGARYADLDKDLAGPVTADSGRHPLPAPLDLARRFGAWGIRWDSRVVAYDDAGGAIAARFWWLMRWMGHEHIALLDGGLSAWRQAGYPLESGEVLPQRAEYAGRPVERSGLSIGEVEAGLNGGSILLLDARERPRFRGEQEPIDAVAGHIPGAVNAPFNENLDGDGRFLAVSALSERFTRIVNQRAPDSVVCMCGSGVTACHNLFAMELAGLGQGTLYVGSWSEWIRSGNRPVATGEH